MNVLALQTAPRPNGLTLWRTLDALKPAGIDTWQDPKLMVADGYTPTVPGWEVVSSPEVMGSSQTFLQLLTQAVSRWPDFEQLIYLQDDIILSTNALNYIQGFKVDPDLAFVTWFSRMWREGIPRGRLKLLTLPLFVGSLALSIPRKTIDALLPLAPAWTRRHECDLFLRQAPNIYYGIHTPNLVDHIEGQNSACGHGHFGKRNAINFAGVNFDAMGLA